MAVGLCKKTNLDNATRLIDEACQGGANIVVLPECFNSPYGIRKIFNFNGENYLLN